MKRVLNEQLRQEHVQKFNDFNQSQSDSQHNLMWQEITSELSLKSMPANAQSKSAKPKRGKGRPKGSRDKKPRVRAASVRSGASSGS